MDTDPLALRLFNAWNQALESGDASAVAGLYAPDAILTPTLSSRTRADRAGIIEYFERFLRKKQSATLVAGHARMIEGLLLHSGRYVFHCNTPETGEVHDLEARFSFVYREDGSCGWKIVDHHSSLMPAGEGGCRDSAGK